MGIIQSFERRLQGAVGNTFARIFGGSVHPSEVITALQNEATGKLEQQGGRIVAPNHFKVRLGPTDRQGLGDDEHRVAKALSDTVREYLAEQGWDTFGDVEVDLEESNSLHTGQFQVSSLVDPDVGARGPNSNYDSGARPVPQQPADPARQGGQYPYQGQDPRQPYPAQPGYPPQYPGHYGYPPQYPGHYSQPEPEPQPPYDYEGYRGGEYPAYPQEQYPQQPEIIASLRADDGSGRTYQLQRGQNVVGRGQEAAFRLPDTSVSRRHVDIYFDGYIAVLHDLGSTNGTTVNGSSVQTWQLADGDVIRIGHSAVVFNQRG